MNPVRLGIIGYGNMGAIHCSHMNDVPGGVLGAICDNNPAKLDAAKGKYNVPVFGSHRELLDSGTCDAIIIAVPHYDHVPIAIDAFEKNVHVMVEKPVAVSVTDARRVNEAYKKCPHLKFGIMFNQRTNNLYRKVRELVADGDLGEITRITWIVTNWFRTWTYYASGGWRATWKGEGGGVLINQCPHNLDLIQFVVNGLMPNRVTAVGFVGKTHPIEVEDEISATLEYPNGAIGHFITSTGEAPGTNRLEVCGDRGKIVVEDGKIRFRRTRKSVREINQKSPESFASVEAWDIDIPVRSNPPSEHKVVTQRFVDVIRNNRPNSELYAEGTEGIFGLELGNAIQMSGLLRRPVELPVNGAEYDQFLEDMHKQYAGRKTLTTRDGAADMAASFAKA
jgi:predicted dehydrogenase